MSKYIKSHSNYVINEKHQTVNGGTIYERDITTIGGRDKFAPGQIPVYRSGNFVITTNGEVQNSYKVGKNQAWDSSNGNFNDVWTLSSISANSVDESSSDSSCIEVKQDIHDLTDFAYWGSCSELFRASVGDILNRYPGEFYLPYNNVNIFTRNWTYTATVDRASINSKEIVQAVNGNKWYYLETGEEFPMFLSPSTKVISGTDQFFSIDEILANEAISGCVNTRTMTVSSGKVQNITAEIVDKDGNTILVKLPDVSYTWGGSSSGEEATVGITAYYNQNTDPKAFELPLYLLNGHYCYKLMNSDGTTSYYDIETFEQVIGVPTKVDRPIYLLDNPFDLDMIRIVDVDDDGNPLKYLRTDNNYENYEGIDEENNTYDIDLDIRYLGGNLITQDFFETSPDYPNSIQIGNIETTGATLDVSVDVSGRYQFFEQWSEGITYCPGDLVGIVYLTFTKTHFDSQLTDFDGGETDRTLSPNAGDNDQLVTVNRSESEIGPISVPIYAFVGDEGKIYYMVDFESASDILGIHIRPKTEFIEDYINSLDTFEKLLVNFATKPLHTAQFNIMVSRSGQHQFHILCLKRVDFKIETAAGCQ